MSIANPIKSKLGWTKTDIFLTGFSTSRTSSSLLDKECTNLGMPYLVQKNTTEIRVRNLEIKISWRYNYLWLRCIFSHLKVWNWTSHADIFEITKITQWLDISIKLFRDFRFVNFFKLYSSYTVMFRQKIYVRQRKKEDNALYFIQKPHTLSKTAGKEKLFFSSNQNLYYCPFYNQLP